MKLIMGIDMGTSKIAISLIDMDSMSIYKTEEAETSYIQCNEPWKKEQSPGEILDTIKTLFYKMAKDLDNVIAIGITGQMHGILGLDNNGKPITNFVTWQDGRGNIPNNNNKNIIQEIKEKAGEVETKGISSGFGIVTLYYWLKNGLRPYKLSTIPDYLGMLLAGNSTPYIDPTMAESLGCFNVKKGDWKKSLLEKLNIPLELLPKLTNSLKIIGVTEGKYFSDLFKKKIPIVVSIGDNQASFLGSVKYHTDTILINVGTGSQISIAENTYEKAASYPFVDGINVQIRPFIEKKYLIAGNAISGGVVYKKLFNFFKSIGKSFWNIKSFDNLYDKMEEVAKEAYNKKINNELNVYPLLAGKRSAPLERGWIKNMGLMNFEPSLLILETLKGMIKILTGLFDESTINSRNYIIGSGNGIKRNRLLQKLISDRFKRELNICKYDEEAVVGAVINTSVATKIFSNYNEASGMIKYIADQN